MGFQSVNFKVGQIPLLTAFIFSIIMLSESLIIPESLYFLNKNIPYPVAMAIHNKYPMTKDVKIPPDQEKCSHVII